MKRKKLLALALALAIVSSFALGVSAAGVAQKIEATLNPDVTVRLGGEAQVFTDANGARVYPVAYNGTTYLPIRALGNLLGLSVGWDQATKTVLLDEPSGVPLFEELDSYANEHGEHVKNYPTQISGLDVSNYACVRTGGYGDKTGNISFNVMGKYNKLTFKAYSEIDCNMKVLGDNGSVLFDKDLPGGQVAQEFTVNLLQTSQLTFQAEALESGYGGYTYFFDGRLDP